MAEMKIWLEELNALMTKHDLKKCIVTSCIGDSITMETTLTAEGYDDPDACQHVNVDDYFQTCDDCGADLGALMEAQDGPVEWSGAPCPVSPDDCWIDDETSDHINAKTGVRTATHTEVGQ